MFIDTRQINDGKALIVTVCIIGGGVAGLTIARELEQAGVDTCVLESGGFEPDDANRDLYRGRSTGIDYQFADGCRARFLGGSSNCWGGWSRPLDAWDFEQRDWIPNSGWPFGLDEIAPYYARTHELLKLGPINFDPHYWEQAIGRKDVRRLPLGDGDVRDTISQFSPPVRFGKHYRQELKLARHVRVFLYANVTELVPDLLAMRIKQVRVQTLNGKSMTVAARLFVLASGGIENARLLLASNRVFSQGVGNQHDLVGRYFMDHPRMVVGQVQFKQQWSRNKLYDIKYHYMNKAVSAHGQHIAAQLALTPQAMQRERVLNARVCFCSEFPGEGSEGAKALFRVKQSLLKKDQPGHTLTDDALAMARDPFNTFLYGFTRLCHPRFLIRNVGFQLIVEPLPDPNSRVSLSTTQRDALGMPRVEVCWKLDPLVRRTADKTLALISQTLQTRDIAQVSALPAIEKSGWPSSFEPEGTWHHMGTTRMHDDERKGVVNRDCRVHGYSNFFISGSSVFPTAGANFPTITIAALAMRLATHIVAELRSSSSAPMDSSAIDQTTSTLSVTASR